MQVRTIFAEMGKNVYYFIKFTTILFYFLLRTIPKYSHKYYSHLSTIFNKYIDY